MSKIFFRFMSSGMNEIDYRCVVGEGAEPFRIRLRTGLSDYEKSISINLQNSYEEDYGSLVGVLNFSINKEFATLEVLNAFNAWRSENCGKGAKEFFSKNPDLDNAEYRAMFEVTPITQIAYWEDNAYRFVAVGE